MEHIHDWEATTSDMAQKCYCRVVRIWVEGNWKVIDRKPKPRRPKHVVAKNCVMF